MRSGEEGREESSSHRPYLSLSSRRIEAAATAASPADLEAREGRLVPEGSSGGRAMVVPALEKPRER